MTSPSALEVAAAIQAAHRKLPGIDLSTRAIGDDAWVADHCCYAIYLSDKLPRAQVVDAIHDAVEALASRLDQCGWPPGLPHPRTQDHRSGLAG